MLAHLYLASEKEYSVIEKKMASAKVEVSEGIEAYPSDFPVLAGQSEAGHRSSVVALSMVPRAETPLVASFALP